MRQNTKRTFFEDFIRVNDEFYILASSPMLDVRTRVLKEGETFAVFDRYGDIQPVGLGEQGIYHEGTRYLSRLLLTLGLQRPLLLSSTVKNDNALLTVDLTNPDVDIDQQIVQPRGTLHIFRAKFLWRGICYERIRISNFGLSPAGVVLNVHYEADFADIFEVRGVQRERKGEFLEEQIEENGVVLRYRGLDDVIRKTRIDCSEKPEIISRSEMTLSTTVQPREEAFFVLTVACEKEDVTCHPLPYDEAYTNATEAMNAEWARSGQIHTSNEQFNVLVNRSLVDLHMMLTETPFGHYPYAGVPWFSTPFGRDGIITAAECLWFNPMIAKGVLAYLAARQADYVSDERDAQPGKILHEERKGEMAALNEVPFGSYYGSVDSTPLFIHLAGAYFERTSDFAFIHSIWPNIKAALAWINQYGDMDGDGFVEYYRQSSNGLVQQGWKDSHDSVFHADGRFAEGPIALCEVQGYVYAARQKAAMLAATLGESELAERLKHQAEELKRRFHSEFWSESLSTYVLALDGEKQQCAVRSSNAGHALFSGIATNEHAQKIEQTLFSDQMYSGWGIRTIGTSEARYNPMSYHNGSVWPHDNALIASGLASYDMKESALRIWKNLYEASLFMDLHRLPELFCGFIRRASEGPTLYPVACAPQAWAAASIFLLIQSCLGLSIDAANSQVQFLRPVLPDFLDKLWIRNLRVGDASMDLELERYEQNVGIKVLRRHGNVKILSIK